MPRCESTLLEKQPTVGFGLILDPTVVGEIIGGAVGDLVVMNEKGHEAAILDGAD